MKYFAVVNGKNRELELTERLGELSIKVDGVEHQAHYEEVDGLGQVALYIDGKAYAISIEGSKNELAVTIAGHVYDVEIEDERERIASAVEKRRGKGGAIKSVMPGVVVGLLVAEGDEVAEDQPLLILEAMKMQNEILAPAAGSVKGIHIEEGQAVPGGELLVTLEFAGTED